MPKKNDITKMPYAQWLEQALREISETSVRGIALVGLLENGDVYTNYWNASMVDKLVLAGLINQDATLDMLAAQGFIEYEEEDEEDKEEMEDD